MSGDVDNFYDKYGDLNCKPDSRLMPSDQMLEESGCESGSDYWRMREAGFSKWNEFVQFNLKQKCSIMTEAKISKYDKSDLHTLLEAQGFTISNVRTFGWDEDYGEGYTEHEVNSNKIKSDLTSLIYDAFQALKYEDRLETDLRRANARVDELLKELAEIKSKIKSLGL